MISYWSKGERIGTFGEEPNPEVVALHGGPAAYGSADRLAEELSDTFRAYSPWQRPSGDIPLSVEVHVEDLKGFIDYLGKDERPALVGESWGAMLALAYGCRYPDSIASIALVGCGTYSWDLRGKGAETRVNRIHEYIEKHPEFRSDLDLPVLERILKWHTMTDTYSKRDDFEFSNGDGFDRQGFEETWNDEMRCQDEGIHPQQFAKITCPVIMLHGAHDPHPGKMTYHQLREFIPHLEYKEFERCGHDPLIEKYAHKEYALFVKSWIAENLVKKARLEA